MDPAELAARPVPWARPPLAGSAPAGGVPDRPFPSPSGTGPKTPFVLLTRLLAFRNFAGEPFAISASPRDCGRLAEMAAAWAERQGLQPAFRLADRPAPVLRLLRERHLLPEPAVPLAGKRGVKHLAPGTREEVFAWINEVEHVTWVQGLAGWLPASDFAAAWNPPAEDPSRPWARSPELGFLASDPSRVGPGISFRILLHLPALALARRLGQAQSAMAALGIQMLPVTRMGPGGLPQDSEPALFWLVSRGGLGRTPEEVYREFAADVEYLLEWEEQTQRRYVEKHRKRLEDRVHGSLQRLAGAVSLGLPEMRHLSSWARLGAYVGILDAQIPNLLEELRVKSQSGHLEVICGRPLVKEEEDMARANVVRLAMERFRTRA